MSHRFFWRCVICLLFIAVLLTGGARAEQVGQPPGSTTKPLPAAPKTSGEGAVGQAETSGTSRPVSDPAPSPKPAITPGQQAIPERKSATPGAPDNVFQLKRRIVELQNRGNLGIGKMVLCSSVRGFGDYSPVNPSGALHKLVLYIQPSNYGTRVTSDRYVIDLTLDLAVYDDKGKLIRERAGILKLKRISRVPVLDLFFSPRINLRGALSRTLVIKTKLKDNIKNATATGTYRINVRSGAKKTADGE
jgi:hypothetical protein